MNRRRLGIDTLTESKFMQDALGDRMKENYENRTRYYLPRRTYTLLRLDGKSFHTYTRKLKKPFDDDLSEDIDNAIIAMLPEIQGVEFVYTQSDEISILLTDFATPSTCAWFDGNLQKTVSVAASVMTAQFNKQRLIRASQEQSQAFKPIDFGISGTVLAYFDCRGWTIPDRIEVMNYFRSRQQDCVRNSLSMVAQSKFSQKELNGKGQSAMHDMLHGIGVNWATDFTDGQKNGRLIVKETYEVENKAFYEDPMETSKMVTRTRWVSKGAWVFTKDEGKLLNMIPKYPYE
jgi:tRNA(His) 5'-end guanylyltransferase